MKIIWRVCEIIYGVVAVLSVGSLVLLIISCELRLAADWIGGGRGEWVLMLTAAIFGCSVIVWRVVR